MQVDPELRQRLLKPTDLLMEGRCLFLMLAGHVSDLILEDPDLHLVTDHLRGFNVDVLLGLIDILPILSDLFLVEPVLLFQQIHLLLMPCPLDLALMPQVLLFLLGNSMLLQLFLQILCYLQVLRGQLLYPLLQLALVFLEGEAARADILKPRLEITKLLLV